MIPPFFLLQTGSLRSVQASLRGFGIDPLLVGLAPCGSENCYVLGDAARVAPKLNTAVAPEDPDSSAVSRGRPKNFGSLWLEKESFEIRRMRSPAGTRVEFGAPASFGKITLPAWFEVREPERDPIRFEIQGVSTSPLSPVEFRAEWVTESPLP